MDEANGLLNIRVGSGPSSVSSCQVAGLTTKDFIVQGDFDVQVDFQLEAGYHSIPDANSKLILLDRNGYGLEISVRYRSYLSKEVFPDGTGIERNNTFTEDLLGRLRIVRAGNLVSTYYWKGGWRKHAEWHPQFVSGDLKVDIDAWNWTPYFSSFNMAFDNFFLFYNGPEFNCSQ